MDRATGVVHIPIERAIDLIAERGVGAAAAGAGGDAAGPLERSAPRGELTPAPAERRTADAERTPLAALRVGVGASSSRARRPPSRARPGHGAAPRAAWSRADEKPAILKDIGIDQRLNEQLPLDLPLRDEAGRAVRLGDYFGKRPVILALVYYNCPMLCTQVLNGLVGALERDVARRRHATSTSWPSASTRARRRRWRPPRRTRTWPLQAPERLGRLALPDGRRRRDRRARRRPRASATATTRSATSSRTRAPSWSRRPTAALARYFYGIEYAPRDLRLGARRGVGRPRSARPSTRSSSTASTTTRRAASTARSIVNIIRLGGPRDARRPRRLARRDVAPPGRGCSRRAGAAR